MIYIALQYAFQSPPIWLLETNMQIPKDNSTNSKKKQFGSDNINCILDHIFNFPISMMRSEYEMNCSSCMNMSSMHSSSLLGTKSTCSKISPSISCRNYSP